MGYDLHITRRSPWHQDESGPPIRLAEWLAYAATDLALAVDPDNGPTAFLCTSDPGDPWPLWWHDGELTTKNPTDAAVAKLVKIGRRLNARVVGDEDEEYPLPAKPARPVRRSWWRRVLGTP